jgi:hypothetical protein
LHPSFSRGNKYLPALGEKKDIFPWLWHFEPRHGGQLAVMPPSSIFLPQQFYASKQFSLEGIVNGNNSDTLLHEHK